MGSEGLLGRKSAWQGGMDECLKTNWPNALSRRHDVRKNRVNLSTREQP